MPPPRESRINYTAGRDALLVVDVERLVTFNMVPGVMCASHNTCTLDAVGSSPSLRPTTAKPSAQGFVSC